MSGSASRSKFARFVKRRLMLLMLKLAIFIGSEGAIAVTVGKDPVVFSRDLPTLKAAPKPDPHCRHSLRSQASRRRRRFHPRHSSSGQTAGSRVGSAVASAIPARRDHYTPRAVAVLRRWSRRGERPGICRALGAYRRRGSRPTSARPFHYRRKAGSRL